MARYSTPEEIARILKELEEEEAEEERRNAEAQCARRLISELVTVPTPPQPPQGPCDPDDDNDPDYEPQEIHYDDHDSESESEMEPGYVDYGMDVDGQDNDGLDSDGSEEFLRNLRFYIGKDGMTLWANKNLGSSSKTKSKNIIKVIPGPKGQAKQCRSPLECFLQIFSHEMIDDIVRFTNIYIQTKKQQRIDDGAAVRESRFRPTTRWEILAVLGALFLIGVKRGNRADFSEFFATNGTGFTILRANFSKERFKFLLRCMRFDNILTREARAETDKLAPIRDLQNKFVTNCQKSYNLGEAVTIDEMLVAFRGRCSFIQYMALKPAKYGLKIYALCDAQTFYTYNIDIYCGMQKPGPFETSNKPYDVVQRLIEPIKNSNRNLTTDNYFSSYSLAEDLLKKGITFLGTLRKNKAEIPPQFIVENRNLVPGSHMFGYQDDKTLISFVTKKKKVVVILSTSHDTNEVDRETGKPIQIMDYNATKGGVDTVDLMCSRISTSRNTQRWPMVVFFRLLDLAGINGMRIWQMNNPTENLLRREFLFRMAVELMEENLRERAKLPRLPKELALFLNDYKDPSSSTVETLTRPGVCYICGPRKNNHSRVLCYLCKKNVCIKHFKATCDKCFEGSEHEEEDTD